MMFKGLIIIVITKMSFKNFRVRPASVAQLVNFVPCAKRSAVGFL